MTTFLHISDTHISGNPAYHPPWMTAGTNHPNVGAKKLLRAIKQLPYAIDFILHTGDVCAEPLADDYHCARDLLDNLPAPIILMPGNHDSGDLLDAIMHDGTGRHVLRDAHLRLGGLHVIALDTSGGGDHAPSLRPQQLDWLESALESCQDGQVIVAAHNPLLKTGVAWLDDSMRVQNGAAAHAILARHSHRIAGVLHGHIHQPTLSCADGVSYISCPSTWSNLAAYPDLAVDEPDPHCPPGYNLLMLRETRLFARRCALPATDA
ncbi:MAG: metallophosphoesterase [Chloroflexi bacterium]|nr:metallophosphoesterase [Chloroflexota bacterium]MCY4247386.1 metallophosphoesterase [Chloroflexota bacterium]